MVLDGVQSRAIDQSHLVSRQNNAFSDARSAFARYCLHDYQHACPLGNSSTSVNDATHHIQDIISTTRFFNAHTNGSRQLSFSDATTAVMAAMYSTSAWNLLIAGLDQLQNKHNGTILLSMADRYYSRNPDGHYSNAMDVFSAVICTDAPPASRLVCSYWPAPYRSTPHELHQQLDKPIVIVSTTGDPATPYAYGVQLADWLHSRLITFRGNGHLASLHGHACIDKVVIPYLDTAIPPEPYVC